jgi:hypothetical protein
VFNGSPYEVIDCKDLISATLDSKSKQKKKGKKEEEEDKGGDHEEKENDDQKTHMVGFKIETNKKIIICREEPPPKYNPDPKSLLRSLTDLLSRLNTENEEKLKKK